MIKRLVLPLVLLALGCSGDEAQGGGWYGGGGGSGGGGGGGSASASCGPRGALQLQAARDPKDPGSCPLLEPFPPDPILLRDVPGGGVDLSYPHFPELSCVASLAGCQLEATCVATTLFHVSSRLTLRLTSVGGDGEETSTLERQGMNSCSARYLLTLTP